MPTDDNGSRIKEISRVGRPAVARPPRHRTPMEKIVLAVHQLNSAVRCRLHLETQTLTASVNLFLVAAPFGRKLAAASLISGALAEAFAADVAGDFLDAAAGDRRQTFSWQIDLNYLIGDDGSSCCC